MLSATYLGKRYVERERGFPHTTLGVNMKLMTLIALLTAFASPASAAIVASKQSGKALCSKNLADRVLASLAPAKARAIQNAGSGR
jgi:hypothetical protein